MGKMISDPEAYFRQFIPSRDDVLKAMEKEAQMEGIPIVGPVVGELLYILARAMDARLILELGTAIGYSSIFLARACKETLGRLITVERDSKMAARAEKNFEKAGVIDVTEIAVGDAIEKMASLDGPFDLIFMDVDKEYYDASLSHCGRLLRIGGLLFTDNVGFRSSEAFNREIFERPEWRVIKLFSFLPEHSPERDALSLALRVK
jgi:caffeoyl-CoA O-methyltransferase